MKLLAVIMTASAAVVWTINAVLHFVYDTSLPLQLLNLLCALLWYIAFLVQLWHYRNNKSL